MVKALIDVEVQPSRYYTTAFPPACSCEGFKYRKMCSHVRNLRQAVYLIESCAKKWRERDGSRTDG